MTCPRCHDTTLIELDREGVTIDRCERCRGIWLDRGELDKLLERAAAASAPPTAPVSRSSKQPDFEDSDYRGGQRYQRDRKKSWLNEIFD